MTVVHISTPQVTVAPEQNSCGFSNKDTIVNRLSNILKLVVRYIWNRQMLAFLFFLMLSAAFWVFQTLNETYEQDIAVPLRLNGQPENVVLLNDVPENIHIRLRDKGLALLQYKYTHKFDTITIDWNDYANGNGNIKLQMSEIVKPISNKLLSTTTLVGCKPETLVLYYNYGQSKRVPVRFQGRINCEEGYGIFRQQIIPDSVTVYASRAILDTITAAYTRPVTRTGVKDTLTISCSLQQIRGARFKPNKIKARFYADRIVSKTISVPVHGVNFPATKVLHTFPPTVQVRFSVSQSNFSNFNEEDFVLVVNYEDLLKTPGATTTNLALKSIPKGVSRVVIIPDQVEYLIEEVSGGE